MKEPIEAGHGDINSLMRFHLIIRDELGFAA